MKDILITIFLVSLSIGVNAQQRCPPGPTNPDGSITISQVPCPPTPAPSSSPTTTLAPVPGPAPTHVLTPTTPTPMPVSTPTAASSPGPAPLPTRTTGREFYVTPAGVSSGDGSQKRPWDLVTALEHPSSVKPGDLIWVAAGTYKGQFNSQLKGTIGAPVIVRAIPGGRVIVDLNNGDTSDKRQFMINGSDTWFWGLEVMDSHPLRETTIPGSHPPDMPRQQGSITVLAPRIKLINVVAHDMANGVRFTTSAIDSEIYGSLMYYNGFHGPERGHGHGIYIQNQAGVKKITNTMAFNNFYAGLHGYAESGTVSNIIFDGFVGFNNGSLEALYPRGESIRREVNLLVGTTKNPTSNIRVLNSHFQIPDGAYATNLQLGYRATGDNVEVMDSVFSGGFRGIQLREQTNYSVKRNKFLRTRAKYGRPVFIDFVGDAVPGSINNNEYYDALPGTDGFAVAHNGTVENLPPWRARGFDQASTYTVGKLPARVYVQRNLYEPCRANLVVYGSASASVDLSGIGCAAGQRFEVRDVQNYYGTPVYQGRYAGQPVTISLTSTVVALPVGMTSAPAHSVDFHPLVVVPLP